MRVWRTTQCYFVIRYRTYCMICSMVSKMIFLWAERVYFYIPEKSQYERPAAGRPAGQSARSRSLNAYFSGTGWPIHERSSYYDVTIQSIMYLTGPDTHRCLPRHTRDPLDNCFPHVWGGVHLHVRTCTPVFQISQAAGRIVFKFGVWLGTY